MSFGDKLRTAAGGIPVAPDMVGAGWRNYVKAVLHSVGGMSDHAGDFGRVAERGLDAIGTGVDAAISPNLPAPVGAVSNKAIDFLTHPGVLVAGTIPAGLLVTRSTHDDRVNAAWKGLSSAQARGEQRMSAPMQSFGKQAGIFSHAQRVTGSGTDAVGEILRKMIMKDTSVDVTDALRARRWARHAPEDVTEAVGDAFYERHGRWGSEDELRQMADAMYGKGTWRGDANTGGFTHAGTSHDLMGDAEDLYGKGSVTYDAATGQFTRAAQEVDPVRLMGLGAAGLAGGTALDLLGPTTDTWGYRVQEQLTGVDDRVKAKDEAVKSFAVGAGKGTAAILQELVGGAMGSAGRAASNASLTFTQSAVLSKALSSDPMLSGASSQEKELLSRAFSSMVRFAPNVATDEFAVRNFLREALMSANGPDYSTLGNLSRVNQSLVGDR